MKNLKNIAIVFVLILSITATSIALPTPVKAATTYNYQTFAYLSCRPDPIGVNQSLLINMWITPPMPQPGIIAHGYLVEITHPDGTKETLGPLNSIQADASMWVEWTPKTLGKYELKVIYPGETVPPGTPYQGTAIDSPYTGRTTDTYVYAPAESPVTKVTVQEEQVPGYQQTALPTEYWNRPVSIENREWAIVGMGDWGMNGHDAQSSYNQPYGGAPSSAHIYWVKTTGVGGIVGDQYGEAIYGGNPPGDTNVARYMTRAVAGMGYYSSTDGVHAIDLTTGEELWVRNDVSISIATEEHYVVRAQGPPIDSYNALLMSIGTNLVKYSAYTGDMICNVSGMSGTFVAPYVYSTQTIGSGASAQRYLIKWNTEGSSTNFTSRIVYNVTYPLGGITAIEGNTGFYYGVGPASVKLSGAFDTETGNILWTKMYTINEASFATSANVLENGVYVFPLYYGDPNQNGLRPLAGIDVKTGTLLYNNSVTSYPWGSFWSYSHSGAYGMAFYPTYSGYVYAFNVTTGAVVWKGGYHPAGYETPYGYQPFFSSIASGGGYVFAGNDEHSENPPYYQGKQMWALNATTGETVWSIAFWSPGFNMQGLIADGKLIATNYYDNRQYCFYQGQTATSITASPKVSDGSSVLIEGMVTDQSPATKDDRAVVKYPQGVPAVSEASMSKFMEYVYMQKPMPTNTTGVPVSIDVIDANGNYRNIGTTTSDASGAFSYQWTPDIEGKYTVIATFAGSKSYWPSHSETSFAVDPIAPTLTPSPVPIQSVADLYFVPAIAGLFVAIAIVGVVMLLALRKRPTVA